MKMTTARIIAHIENDTVSIDWSWECAIESACGYESRDAADAARFLEQLEPGKQWEADEYHGLMYHHFSGRWESDLEIAHIRLGEWRESMREKHAASPGELERIETFYNTQMADEALAVRWLERRAGTYVFRCADGTVLVFDGIYAGVIDPEDPT